MSNKTISNETQSAAQSSDKWTRANKIAIASLTVGILGLLGFKEHLLGMKYTVLERAPKYRTYGETTAAKLRGNAPQYEIGYQATGLFLHCRNFKPNSRVKVVVDGDVAPKVTGAEPNFVWGQSAEAKLSVKLYLMKGDDRGHYQQLGDAPIVDRGGMLANSTHVQGFTEVFVDGNGNLDLALNVGWTDLYPGRKPGLIFGDAFKLSVETDSTEDN